MCTEIYLWAYYLNTINFVYGLLYVHTGFKLCPIDHFLKKMLQVKPDCTCPLFQASSQYLVCKAMPLNININFECVRLHFVELENGYS